MAKYRNKKIEHNGEVFDSVKEWKRFEGLKLLEKAGAIEDLQRQVKFVLIPAQYEPFKRFSGKTGKRLKDGKKCVEKAVTYYADFVYKKDGETVVEDVKGYRRGTAFDVFAIKRKLMLKEHGIKVKEI